MREYIRIALRGSLCSVHSVFHRMQSLHRTTHSVSRKHKSDHWFQSTVSRFPENKKLDQNSQCSPNMDRSAKRERTKNTVSTMPRSRGMVPVLELNTVFKSLATAQSIKKGSKQNRTPIPTQKDVHKFTANHRVQGSREGIDPQIGDQKDTKLFQFRLIEQHTVSSPLHTMDCTESGESGRDSISGHSFPESQ